jgi:hypothetical protein
LSSSGSRTRTPRDGSFAIASKNLSAWTAKPFGRRSGRRSGQVVGAIDSAESALVGAARQGRPHCRTLRANYSTATVCQVRRVLTGYSGLWANANGTAPTSSTMRSFGSDSRFIIVEITFSNVRARCGATAVGSAEKVARANTA